MWKPKSHNCHYHSAWLGPPVTPMFISICEAVIIHYLSHYINNMLGKYLDIDWFVLLLTFTDYYFSQECYNQDDVWFCLLFLIINYFSKWNLLLAALYQSQPGCLRRLLTFIICIRHHARYKQLNVLLSLETMLQWSNASMHHKIARGEQTRERILSPTIYILLFVSIPLNNV